jgi:hypothetical protein
VNDEQFDLVGVPVPAGGTWRRASGAVRGAGRVDLLRGARALCRRLDGMPLALELAATRVRILTAREIEEGLTDRFRLLTGGPRDAPSWQRTLEASLDWSYGLLEPPQQLALARLSVFVGTFDLEAARSVIAGDGIGISGALDLLTALAERSLLQVEVDDGRARYRLLESVRLYASARLAELDDPDRVLDRHLEFHVELAEQARAGLAGRHARPWTARLAPALDDLRSAMDRGMASQRPRVVLDVAEPTFRFWFEWGLYPEMRRRLDAAVGDPYADDADRARGSVVAALLAISGGDFAEALVAQFEGFVLVQDPGLTNSEVRGRGCQEMSAQTCSPKSRRCRAATATSATGATRRRQSRRGGRGPGAVPVRSR